MQEHFTDGKRSHGYIWNWWQRQQETRISLLQVPLFWEIPNKTTALITKGAEVNNRLHFFNLCLKIEKYPMISTAQRYNFNSLQLFNADFFFPLFRQLKCSFWSKVSLPAFAQMHISQVPATTGVALRFHNKGDNLQQTVRKAEAFKFNHLQTKWTGLRGLHSDSEEVPNDLPISSARYLWRKQFSVCMHAKPNRYWIKACCFQRKPHRTRKGTMKFPSSGRIALP